jgi:hypothetical protein
LTFHLNDFETTPVAFREADGTLVVFAPNWPVRRLNPWLFQHSYIYRYWLGLVTPKKITRAEIIAEVRASLADLERMVAVDGARLTVLVLPILRPLSDWKPEYQEYRRLIRGILESLRLRYFDLLEPLHEALADGVVVTETGDKLFWHPSREAATYFAKYLRTQHLLDGHCGLRYGNTGPCQCTPAEVAGPGAAFIVAWRDAQPVGCGAIRPLEQGVAAVKRMFVEAPARRRGMARQMLQALEHL